MSVFCNTNAVIPVALTLSGHCPFVSSVLLIPFFCSFYATFFTGNVCMISLCGLHFGKNVIHITDFRLWPKPYQCNHYPRQALGLQSQNFDCD